jgi:hypothetical protein
VRIQPDLFGAGRITEDWADPEGFQTRVAAIDHAAGPPTPDTPRGTQLAEGSLATARAWLAGRTTHPLAAGSPNPTGNGSTGRAGISSPRSSPQPPRLAMPARQPSTTTDARTLSPSRPAGPARPTTSTSAPPRHARPSSCASTSPTWTASTRPTRQPSAGSPPGRMLRSAGSPPPDASPPPPGWAGSCWTPWPATSTSSSRSSTVNVRWPSSDARAGCRIGSGGRSCGATSAAAGPPAALRSPTATSTTSTRTRPITTSTTS